MRPLSGLRRRERGREGTARPHVFATSICKKEGSELRTRFTIEQLAETFFILPHPLTAMFKARVFVVGKTLFVFAIPDFAE